MNNDVKTDFVVKFDQNALKTIIILANATNLDEKTLMMNALGFYMWAFNEWKAGRRIGSIERRDDEDFVQFIKLAFMETDEKSSDSGKSELS